MFLRREHLAALVVAVSLAASAQPSRAQWNVNGVPVCTAANNQIGQTIVPDGAGGAIVAWSDNRNGNYHIYAQHLLASGAVDPVWTAANGNADGTPLCTAAGGQGGATIVPDGAGGAIVTWQDDRSGTGDIYAQHVMASGAVDPIWTAANGNADGTPLCTAVALQTSPTIVTDGAGGAIVTWMDQRIYPLTDVYAQHVLASGAVDPAWPADGRGLTATGGYFQSYPTGVPDGAGGAIVTWTNAYGAGIYAQHLLASGAVDSVWTNANGNADGTPLCTAAGGPQNPTIVPDGSGGAIVTWMDGRSNITHNIYAQRVDAAGVVRWIPDGTPVCAAAGDEQTPTIVMDGTGGAIVTWMDGRNNVTGTGYDVYTQHVLESGVVDPAWPADGLGLTAAGGAGAQTIGTDMAGGAIVTWEDLRSGEWHIYAQHVLASGAADGGWPVNGRELCTTPGYQQGPTIVTDGLSGAIVAWWDERNGSSNIDIYAQHVSGSGVSAVAMGGSAYSFAVHAPHPNPASPQATISFDLASPQPVSVRVFDVAGRLVRTLAAGGKLGTGSHSLMWNGASDSGALAHAGIYFIRVSAGSAVQTRRVAIIR